MAYTLYDSDDFKKLLKTYVLKPSSTDAADPPFPFFRLPELVINKILRDYVPVSVKAGALSRLPPFQTYLAQKHVWWDSTLQFYRQVQAVIPGWYVDPENWYRRYYVSVNDLDLKVTIYHFEVKGHRFSKKAVYKGIRQVSREKCHFNQFQDDSPFIRIQENDLLMYPYDGMYLWFFRPHSIVYNPKVQLSKNNQCLLVNPPFHHTNVLFTFQDVGSATLTCQDYPRKCAFTETIKPLSFVLCPEMGTEKPSECPPCRIGFHWEHPEVKETYVNFDNDQVSVIRTEYQYKCPIRGDF